MTVTFALRGESSIWRAYDKHAQAYAVLEGDRGKQIGKVLFKDEKAVLKPGNGCLSCHAMHNLSKVNQDRGAARDQARCTPACWHQARSVHPSAAPVYRAHHTPPGRLDATMR